MVWWPDSSAEGLRVWGVPAWLRLVRQLRRRGVTDLFAAGPSGRIAPEAIDSGLRRLDGAILQALPPDAVFLVTAADWVVDEQMFDALLQRSRGGVLVTRGDGVSFAGAARLGRAEMMSFDLTAGAGRLAAGLVDLAGSDRLEPIDVATLPDYRAHLRRRIPVFAIRIGGPADRRLAERRLLDATQKGTNDLPAQYVHPPLENALVRLLVPLGVTPDMVTTTTVVVGLAAAMVFVTGHLVAGTCLAMVVGVLDGVDGKIARVTLTATRHGDWFEHISDNIYEVLWYLAIGEYLAGHAHLLLYRQAAWITIGAYLLDRGALGIWKLFRDGDFHESSAWDRAFRRYCGRRNTIVYLLAGFFVVGYPEAGFLTAMAWWIVTFVVHAARVSRALHRGLGREPAG